MTKFRQNLQRRQQPKTRILSLCVSNVVKLCCSGLDSRSCVLSSRRHRKGQGQGQGQHQGIQGQGFRWRTFAMADRNLVSRPSPIPYSIDCCSSQDGCYEFQYFPGLRSQRRSLQQQTGDTGVVEIGSTGVVWRSGRPWSAGWLSMLTPRSADKGLTTADSSGSSVVDTGQSVCLRSSFHTETSQSLTTSVILPHCQWVVFTNTASRLPFRLTQLHCVCHFCYLVFNNNICCL